MESGFMGDLCTTARAATALSAAAVPGGMAIFGLVDNLIPLITKDIGVWQFHATRRAIALPVPIGMGLAVRCPGALRSAPAA